MTENIGWAALGIIPSLDGFEGKLNKGVDPAFRKVGLLGGKTFGDSAGKSLSSSFKSHAKTAALVGGAAFTAAAGIAFKIGKDSLQGYEDHLRVVHLTQSTIKATGSAARITTKQVGALSDALEAKTGVDGDAIQSGANMLLTFKNIRNEQGKGNKIFDQSLSILTDLSTAMGSDAKNSAIQLGKALNDPLKGISALSRVGVTFDDQQKKQIANFVKQGDVASAQKVILGELSSEFGGAAAAQVTLGDKVAVQWHRIQDDIGAALLPIERGVERTFLKKGVPAIEGWSDSFEKKGVPALKHFGHWVTTDGVDKFEDFYKQAKPVADDVLPAIFDLLGASKPILKTSAHLVGDLADGFTKIPHWAQVAIAGGLLTGKAGGFKLAANLVGSKGGFFGGVSKAAPLPVYVVNQTGVPGTPGGKIPAIVPWLKGVPPETIGKLPKLAPFIPLGLDSAPGQDSLMYKLFGVGLKGDHSKALPLPPEVRAYLGAQNGAFDGLTGKVKGFGDELDLVGAKKIHPELTVPGLAAANKALGEFISKQVTAGKPITPYVITTPLERAIQQADTLLRKLDAIAERGLDNGVNYVHGGQRPSGVNFNGPIHVQPHDYNDFVGQMQRRTQQAGMGGRP